MTYFSVDVETTSTVVIDNGLLSIGVQVVNEDLSLGEEWYGVIKSNGFLTFKEDTLEWWMQQDPEIYKEARNTDRNIYGEPGGIAMSLRAFVTSTLEEGTKAIFVANPVAFDKPWIDQLFHSTNMVNPFDYRSLCLRSMHFGLRKVRWGQDREEWGEFSVSSERPHHALYDAKAQAQELILMLKARDGSL